MKLLIIFTGLMTVLSTLTSVSFSYPIGSANTATVTTNPHYQEGKKALDQGLLLEAEKAFREGLRKDANNPHYLLGLAEIAQKRKDSGTSHSYLQQALNLAPESYLVQTAWGRYLYSQGEFTEAQVAFIKANELNPQATAPLIDLATLYASALNKPDKAVELYRKALSIDPTLAGTHYALGTSLIKLGKFNEAQFELNQAARLAPDNARPFLSLGELYTRENNLAAAQKAYTSALQIDPELLPALLGRGDILTALKQHQQAFIDYSKALEIAPDFAPTHTKIGMLHQSQGNYTEAQNSYLDAIDIDPQIAIAYNNLAYIASEQRKDLQNALIWATEATTLAPKIPQFQDTLAWVHRARSEHSKAIDILEYLCSQYPSHPDFFYHLGIIYSETSNVKKAVHNLEKAISLSKNYNFAEIEDARHRLSKIK